MRRSSLLSILILMGLCLVLPFTAHAAARSRLSFRVGCDGFISRGGEIVLDRDNTAAGREQFVISAVDGHGNWAYAPALESFVVGSRINMTAGLFFKWTAAPTANPITVSVVSPAGNGHAEQVIYTVEGACADVETVTAADFDILTEVDGRTSPSVALNSVPPRDTNPTGINTGRWGHLIVNTDNLYIRSGDSHVYTTLGIVDGGTELVVLGRNEARSWWYVQVGSLIGWVRGDLTVIRGDLTAVPVVPVTGELTRPTLYLFANKLLRAVPQADSLSVCELAGDHEYYIVGRTANNLWLQLEATCNDATVYGWVEADKGGIRNPAAVVFPITD